LLNLNEDSLVIRRKKIAADVRMYCKQSVFDLEEIIKNIGEFESVIKYFYNEYKKYF